jgi:hypothetical protein
MAHSSAVYAASRLIRTAPRIRCSKVQTGAFGPTNGPTAANETTCLTDRRPATQIASPGQ